MDLRTKFSRGDAVWVISRGRLSRKGEPCSGCATTSHPGRILVAGKLYDCPGCKGKGQNEVAVHGWYISASGIVARIDVVVNAAEDGWEPPAADEFRTYNRGSPLEIRYGLGLAHTRWVGGNLHDESSVVGGSREVAQAECDRRNTIEGVREYVS